MRKKKVADAGAADGVPWPLTRRTTRSTAAPSPSSSAFVASHARSSTARSGK